jgi:hypothetical protein
VLLLESFSRLTLSDLLQIPRAADASGTVRDTSVLHGVVGLAWDAVLHL